ncbi:hypothetical protein, unlikely [Trypanosoma brucei gambiense DAL972]|uniref:Uncharacterized protein n=1 Tax=Trypanosoma brucei gambiense (strain MHOM/CI/86/DAL972) TaxID=679716 RepID=C9ZPE2_TRYB9|nr:hypothetical protein, unlikely [Trypanosoma brucei gambiense DAL972]CBH11270.1 hypothetical protein, unlikely [Trypanosoma brucei gambiense DAL972]|eukprot:XP_011773557.1 hypothetical protein, unlikely [Trypanosoma brucei gambiense DAL972]
MPREFRGNISDPIFIQRKGLYERPISTDRTAKSTSSTKCTDNEGGPVKLTPLKFRLTHEHRKFNRASSNGITSQLGQRNNSNGTTPGTSTSQQIEQPRLALRYSATSVTDRGSGLPFRPSSR